MILPKSVDKTKFLYATDANEVYSLIRNCKITNSFGLDGLSNNLPKIAGPVISDFLAVILNRCFQVGYFPNIPKIAIIKPLSKIGDTQKSKNYRPISLLSSFSEICEKSLVKKLEIFWEKCDVLNSKQHAFGKWKSALNALIDLTETIRSKISESEKTICIFLDLSKAFDTVSHGILLKKREAYGGRGNVLQLLASFSHNRKHFVQTDEKVSEVRDINGVTQGSVLGPLLFLLLINDITDTQDKIFANFPFCRWLFNFDISLTQSFPSTWKAITSNQQVIECQQTYSKSWKDILPKVR